MINNILQSTEWVLTHLLDEAKPGQTLPNTRTYIYLAVFVHHDYQSYQWSISTHPLQTKFRISYYPQRRLWRKTSHNEQQMNKWSRESNLTFPVCRRFICINRLQPSNEHTALNHPKCLWCQCLFIVFKRSAFSSKDMLSFVISNSKGSSYFSRKSAAILFWIYPGNPYVKSNKCSMQILFS